MPATINVDLHCHSRHSDGKLWPEEIVDHLAARGIAIASLVDHDTIDGQVAFRTAASRRGMGCITGVELTAYHRDREIHLLGYGFDPGHAELVATLASIRQSREQAVASIADDVRTRTAPSSAASAAPDGRLALEQAIALIHRAGGKAFLAHPLTMAQNPEALRDILGELKAAGLDGIEAIYASYDPAQRDALVQLAQEQGLLVSAGSDFHDPAEGGQIPGIAMSTELWKPLRDAVVGGQGAGTALSARPAAHRHSWRRFVFHIILPTALAILLFAVAIWGFFLPTFERSLLERKREMIRALTQSAWSILAEAHGAEQRGELSRETAQKLAAQRIAAMRYGREGKDYFWVQDLTPRMVMHPYRQDLNGQDVSDFKDPRGARIFVEFADLVRRREEGYVEYVWQWQDDPRRLALKESYVKGFAPWNWAIGTGIYIDDVNQEIARVERGLVYGSLAIVAVVSLLLLYVMRESLKLERDRSQAEAHLRESTQRYQSLVEASTEGALLVVDGRCRYANPVLLKLLSRTPQEMELLDLEDVLPRVDANTEAHERIERVLGGEEMAGGVEAVVRCADGRLRDAVLGVSPMRLEDKGGVILLVKDFATSPRPLLPSGSIVRQEDAQKLTADIAAADSPDQVVRLCRRVPKLAAVWLAGGIYPRHITRMVAGVCDAATIRFIELAQRDLGPAPAEFAWVALGSQGRQEQTLFTDQDNAILLADGADLDRARPYCAELGTRVCHWLDEAGYVLCRGNVMARNPKWCQPLAAWKRTFRDWIAKAEPKELLELSIFFDLRTVWGPVRLEQQLRQDTAQALVEAPGFFPYFAQNSLEFKPPMRLFGHILPAGESPGMLDLKHAMMPIVNFARLYGLKHQLPPTGTLDRIAAMIERELLSDTTRQDLSYAYEFLMRLRLEHQLGRLQTGLPPDNQISLRGLSHTEQMLLKEAFTQIDAVQQKISYEFLGGTT